MMPAYLFRIQGFCINYYSLAGWCYLSYLKFKLTQLPVYPCIHIIVLDMALEYRRRCKDFVLIFLTRIMRMFSYGMLAVVFFQNLFGKGLSQTQASWMQSCIVFGDILVSLVLTTQADRFGRINTLMIGAILKTVAGLCYAQFSNVPILLIAGILGVISVSGGQIGPFMPIEQSALSQLVEVCTDDNQQVEKNIALVFGYYNMAGYMSQATGAAFAGLLVNYMVHSLDFTKAQATSSIVKIYALIGIGMFFGYCMMKRDIEPAQVKQKKVLNCTGIHKDNIPTILTLSALFAVDAFGGAFIVQSYLSLYYQKRYGLYFDKIGAVLFVCNIISGISGVLSSKLVQRIGAMATMIYTHLPSNFFLLMIAATSSPVLSVIFLLGRFCISQMDVPARQTYVSMVVSSQERSAANGITNIARSVGLTIGLGLNGYFMSMPPDSTAFSFPFIIAGGLKIIYDITIGCCFLWRKKQQKREVQMQQIEQVNSTDLPDTPHPNIELVQEKE